MAKRGYKLQEFIAHSGNVNCLSFAKKRRGLFITGGDDQVVNLWSIGNPTALTSLSGHTSPVESVAFDSEEAFVVAGASSGAIKMWDMEETRMVHNFNGHRSYCTAVQFHPSGELFVSGSKDTNLKMWDIRKKECIHTYKGHIRGISTVRFTPDGRWLVSGGFDNVVKIWDLTAGKLLHDLKLHEGHIRSIAFHPMELLMATGSADKTVKFWDLETFELIGSSRPESTGVRSITFHPEGKRLFSGLDDSLKIYSWEPVVCHDAVDLGWSTLGDICIHDREVLGGSYYQNFVGVWVTDTSLLEPYRESSLAKPDSKCEQVHQRLQDIPIQKVDSFRRSTSSSSLVSSDNENKEIKNIYVDTAGENPITARKAGSIKSSKIFSSSNTKEIIKPWSRREVPAVGLHVKPIAQTTTEPFTVRSAVPQDSSDAKEASISLKESIASAKAGVGMLAKPSHIRRHSNTTLNARSPPRVAESSSFSHMKDALDGTKNIDFRSRLVADDNAKESSQERRASIKNVVEDSEKLLSSRIPSSQDNRNESQTGSKGVKAVKYVNGVAVVHGRTRSLVERFEKRENFSELQTPCPIPQITSETSKASTVVVDVLMKVVPDASKLSTIVDSPPQIIPDTAKVSTIVDDSPPRVIRDTAKASTIVDDSPPRVIRDTAKASTIVDDSPPRVIRNTAKASTIVVDSPLGTIRDTAKASPIVVDLPSQIIPDTAKASTIVVKSPPRIIRDTAKASTIVVDSPPQILPDTAKASAIIVESPTRVIIPNRARTSTRVVDPPARIPNTTRLSTSVKRSSRRIPSPRIVAETLEASPVNSHPELIRREPMFQSDDNLPENLMKIHDVFLSTLRSRLTKLQVVRHFLEGNDIKGAINAMQKLPDHSVQAELISVLVGKRDILTLDLFSCLLPVLLGLLDSKAERHVNVSLEMLLKLVAVFGPVISSTISAPPAVGVNLQAEQRLECCNKCSILLQRIQKTLPAVIRRGGILEKCARELSLVLQNS